MRSASTIALCVLPGSWYTNCGCTNWCSNDVTAISRKGEIAIRGHTRPCLALPPVVGVYTCNGINVVSVSCIGCHTECALPAPVISQPTQLSKGIQSPKTLAIARLTIGRCFLAFLHYLGRFYVVNDSKNFKYREINRRFLILCYMENRFWRWLKT